MNPVIKIDNVTKIYDDIRAIDQVTMHINKGDIYGLIGLNGAGKTTLIHLLLGLSTPTSGAAYLFGERVNRQNYHLWKNVGYVVDTSHAYPDLTVGENLHIQRRLRQISERDTVNRVIERLYLTNYKHKKVKHLSLGNKQRLSIASAILHRPSILLLDEPVNGLDPEGIVEVRHLLQRLAEEDGVTILISSHLLTELSKLMSTVGILHKGKLVKQINTPDLYNRLQKEVIVDSFHRSLLRRTLKKEHYSFYQYNDGTIAITNDYASTHPHHIAELLMKHNVPLTKLYVKEETLEQYFLRIIHQGE